jgi:hypothetical protein
MKKPKKQIPKKENHQDNLELILKIGSIILVIEETVRFIKDMFFN